MVTEVERWYAEGRPFALATVVSTWQSAPRPAGAAMVVSADGEVVGSVSGGCVEGAVYELAQEVLAGGDPVLQRYGVSDDDAFAVGLTCGGILDVFVEPVDATTFPELPAVARLGGGSTSRWPSRRSSTGPASSVPTSSCGPTGSPARSARPGSTPRSPTTCAGCSTTARPATCASARTASAARTS